MYFGRLRLNEQFYEKLRQILNENQIKTKEPLANHTTLRIGGGG